MTKSIQCPLVIRYNEFTLYLSVYMRFCRSCTAYVRTYIRTYVCCECSGYSVALRTYIHTYIRTYVRMQVYQSKLFMSYVHGNLWTTQWTNES